MASKTSIPQSIETIFEKLSTSQTYHEALEEFKSLIETNTPSAFIKEIIKHFSQINNDNKAICHLFPLFFIINQDQIEVASQIVAFIEKSITESNASIFSFIAKIFGETIHELYQSDLSNENRDKAYKVLLQICLSSIYNKEHYFKLAGLLLLSEFIENCPLITTEFNMKFIWKTLGRLVDDRDHPFKLEVLNCVISLIYATESNFRPFACDALFKILDYLTDQDWLIRKLSLNVVYSLSFYCKNEILPLKENIIEFLNVLKYDKVKEIEEVCVQTLQFYQQEDSDKEKDKKVKNNPKGMITNAKASSDVNNNYSKETTKENKARTNSSEHYSKTDKEKHKDKDKGKDSEQYHSNSITHKSRSNCKHKGPKAIKNIETKTETKASKSNRQNPNDQMLLDQDILKLNNTQAKRDSFFSNKQSAVSKCTDSEPNPYFSNRLSNKLKNKPISTSLTKSNIQDYINSHTHNANHDNDNYNTLNNENNNNSKSESSTVIPALSQTAEKKIEELVEQIKLINENQLSLISAVDRIESLTKSKYDEFDDRLSTLEKTFSSFTNGYYEAHYMNEIEASIRRNDIVKAFSLSINNENLILQTIPLIKQRQLIKVPQEEVDNYLLKTIALIGNEKEVEKILSFILQVYSEKICVKSSVKQIIKEALNNILQNENNNNYNEVILNKIKSVISHSY